jgi:hypothetical protein
MSGLAQSIARAPAPGNHPPGGRGLPRTSDCRGPGSSGTVEASSHPELRQKDRSSTRCRTERERGRHEAEGASDRGAPPRSRRRRRRVDPPPSLGAHMDCRRPTWSRSRPGRRSRAGNLEGDSRGGSPGRGATPSSRGGCRPSRPRRAGRRTADAERRLGSAASAPAPATSATAATASPSASAAAASSPTSATASAPAATTAPAATAPSATADLEHEHAARPRLRRPKPPPHRSSRTQTSAARVARRHERMFANVLCTGFTRESE